MTAERQETTTPSGAEGDHLKTTLLKHIVQWIDDRTGVVQILHKILNEPIPGGSRFAYVFGSALLFIFVLQFITGLSLALYYVPSPVTAHVSVSYIVKQVAAGSFLRSLHSYGSSAMVVVLLLHFLQTFLYGSYKGKRELLWIAGCVLSVLVLGMSFTGYLLPWDQKAYFATSVGTNVAGQAPLVGEWMRRLLRGGTSMGTLTISRFYVLHVFVIPALIVFFVVLHVALFRKARPAGPITGMKAPVAARPEMFYPNQVLKDMAFALVVMGILGMLAYSLPVKLGPIANPADSHYLPRPEWYYLPLFQWLKYWEGPRAVIGMVVIPTILVALLFLLPFLDRGVERRPWRRPIPVGSVAIVLMGVLWLGIRSRVDDSRNPATSGQLAQQQKEEDEYFRKPFQPYRASLSSERFVPVRLSEQVARGKALFDSHGCSGCHGRAGSGGVIGPALTHISEKYQPSQVAALLKDPTARMREGGMVPPKLAADEIVALVAFLGSLGTPGDRVWTAATTEPLIAAGAKSSSFARPENAKSSTLSPVALDRVNIASNIISGVQIFQSHACTACHGEGGVGTQRAPALINVGNRFSAAALTYLLRNPTAKMTAGGMPQLDLNDSELSSLVSYLRDLRPEHKATPSAESLRAATGQGEIQQIQPITQDAVVLPVSELAPAPSTQSSPAADGAAATMKRETLLPQSRGEGIFESHGCSACHGTGGVGTRLAPALTNVRRTMQAAELTALIGHPTAKMRAGGMPQVKLSAADMDALVEFIENLGATGSLSATVVTQRKPLPSPDLISSSVQSQAQPAAVKLVMSQSEQAGKSIFNAHGCSRCHGVEGRDGTAAAPPLAGMGRRIPPEILTQMLQHPTNHMRKGGMPVVSVTRQELGALANYVSYISGVTPILQPEPLDGKTSRSSLELGQDISY